MLRNGVRLAVNQAKNAKKTLFGSSGLIPTQASRSFSKEAEDVKLPLSLYGPSGKYASALYVSAAKAKTLETVESEIHQILQVSDKNPTFAEFLKDPSVPKANRNKAIEELFEAAKFSPITKNFFFLLSDAGRLGDLSKISSSYSELLRAYRKEVLATVTSAQPLDQDEIDEVKEAIKLSLPKGSTLKLETVVNPKIIGGLVIDIGDKHIDLSIDTKIKQLEKVLAESL